MEGTSDPDDLFNLTNVHVATVDIVMNSGDCGDNGLVGGRVVGEGDCCLHSTKWCLNGGINTWNCQYGWCNVLLVGVVEFAGGWLIGVWEVTVPDTDKDSRGWVLYA